MTAATRHNQKGKTMTGIDLISAERMRQVDSEGWTKSHDDTHTIGELADAAEAYLCHKSDAWPWDSSDWKPISRVSDLVKAGALIAAEIDRLQRMETGDTTEITTSRYHERNMEIQQMFKQVVGKLPILIGVHRIVGDVDGEEHIQHLYSECLAALSRGM